MQYVYLAGPISGLTYEEASAWRREAAGALDRGVAGCRDGVHCLSPLRFKPYLADHGEIGAHDTKAAALNVLSTNRGILTRDRFDALRSSVVLVNMFGAKRAAFGTTMEIAWANQAGIPVVCVMEPGNMHEHSMILEAIDFRVHSLEEAIKVVKAILG